MWKKCLGSSTLELTSFFAAENIYHRRISFIHGLFKTLWNKMRIAVSSQMVLGNRNVGMTFCYTIEEVETF